MHDDSELIRGFVNIKQTPIIQSQLDRMEATNPPTHLNNGGSKDRVIKMITGDIIYTDRVLILSFEKNG